MVTDMYSTFLQLLDGFKYTLIIFGATLLFSIPLGLLVAKGRMSRNRIVSGLIRLYISVMRGTPLMLQLMVVYFGPYFLFNISLRDLTIGNVEYRMDSTGAVIDGTPTIDQYLGFMQQDMAAFRDQVREDAAKRVATRIVLRSIGAQENVEVSDEDLVKELERMAEVYKMDVENVRKMIGEDNIGYFRKDIALTKVMDLIYNNAKINLISEEEAAARMAEEVKKQAEAGEEKAEEGEDK